MNIFNSKAMHEALTAMLLPNEHYQYPVYVGFGRESALSTSAMNNRYGFVAATDFQRLIFVKFNMMGIITARGSYPLFCIENVDINEKTLFNRCKVKITFNVDGKESKLKFTASRKVYTMGLDEQEQNLEGLFDVLRK